MNFLNLSETVNLGGHKLSVDDLAYLQNSVLDVVEALAFIHGNGGDACLLSDLQITDNGTTFNVNKPAVVYYNAKLYRVEPDFNVPKTVGGQYKFKLVTVINPSNPVTYGSGAQINVHKYEYMQLVYTNITGPDYINFTTFTGSEWQPYTPTVGAMTYAGGGEHLNCRYRVQGKTMYLSIDFIGQLDNVTAPSITLPFDYKFKYDGNSLLAGTTPPAADGAENIIRTSWNAGLNDIRFGDTTGGALPIGAAAIHDTLVFEIA